MLEDMLNRPLQPLLMNFYGLRAYIRARWTSYWTVSLAGFAVIVIGALCLGSSALIAATGSWWQGTLYAFGVGFVVGGVIDILAIFTLNQFVSRDTHRRASANQRARRILATKLNPTAAPGICCKSRPPKHTGC